VIGRKDSSNANHTHNRLMTHCPEIPGWASTRYNLYNVFLYLTDLGDFNCHFQYIFPVPLVL